MKTKTKVLLLTIILIGIFTNGETLGWSYPFKKISKIECKYMKRSEHGSDCKRDLPIIKNADYQKYKNNTKMRLIYSVLWGATYKNGWDIGNGSHLGVDIPSAKGTPVYSIGDGKVIFAGWKSGWGNTVVIKHKINGKYIYSNYSHLNKISTSYGNYIDEGKKIGEVGHTGNSWGNHLHFQIDTSSKIDHPFFFSCKAASNIAQMVNKGECRDELTEYTIDPIHFLETNGAEIKIARTQKEITEQAKELEEKNKINPNTIVSREQLRLTELEMFLARYDLSSKSKIPANVLDVGEKGEIQFNAKDIRGKKYDGILPVNIEIVFDNEMFDIKPIKFKNIENGKRIIDIIALKPGVGKILFKAEGGKILESYNIRVKGNNTNVEVENSIIKTFGNSYIGESKRGIIIMKDGNYNNIIDVPYGGNFKLSTTQNQKLCPSGIDSLDKLHKLNSLKCKKSNLKNSINFNYQDTLKGLMLFKIIPKSKGSAKVNLYKNSNKIGESQKEYIYFPKDLNFKNPYYEYIKKSLTNLLTRTISTNKGYFGSDFNIRETTAIRWIENTFPGEKKINGNKYHRMTRLEFVKLICQNLGISINSEKRYFKDVKRENYKYVNLLGINNIRFLDKFENYFQPNKKIKRDEAAYILYQLYQKIK